MRLPVVALLSFPLFFLSACGDDAGTEADRIGVGAACVSDDECESYDDEDEGDETGDIVLECLPQFTGGYCGIRDCNSNEDCPEASACVAHSDGVNYCFRICLDKSECNENRPPSAESNCSANITFVDPDTSAKACVPPSSGS